MLKLNLIFALAVFVLTACGAAKQQESTPTGAFKAYIEAANKKDAAAMKNNLSKGSLTMLEAAAKTQNSTLDEALQKQSNPTGAKLETPETRNEKIEGANATLEIKNPQTGTWDKVYFALEDGQWKIALDKFMEEMMKEMDAQGAK